MADQAVLRCVRLQWKSSNSLIFLIGLNCDLDDLSMCRYQGGLGGTQNDIGSMTGFFVILRRIA